METAFDYKGLLNSYKNDVILTPKKNISANKADVKKDKEDKRDIPEAVKTFKEEFHKVRLVAKKTWNVEVELLISLQN